MNILLKILIAVRTMISLKSQLTPRANTLGVSASIMIFRTLIGIMMVAAVIISIEHLATSLIALYNQYQNGLYFSLATFSGIPIAAIATLYFLFHRTPLQRSPAETLLPETPELSGLPHLAVRFFDGFNEGLAANVQKLEPEN